MAGTLSKTDQKKYDTALALLNEEVKELMPQIAAAVPSHVRPDALVRTLFNVIATNPSVLLKCTPVSIGRCLVEAATYGLEIASTGQLGQAYVVPYGDQANLQLSYKGVKELVRRSGQGVLTMGIVRLGDTITRPTSKMQDIAHVESDEEKRHEQPVTAAYAVMHFNNGMKINVYWTVAKCKSHRDQYSKTWQAAVKAKRQKKEKWHEDDPAFGKMCAKSCVHALCNDGDVPLSSELLNMMNRSHEAQDRPPSEGYQPPADADIIDPAPLKDKDIPVDTEDVDLSRPHILEQLNACENVKAIMAVYTEFEPLLRGNSDDHLWFSSCCTDRKEQVQELEERESIKNQ